MSSPLLVLVPTRVELVHLLGEEPPREPAPGGPGAAPAKMEFALCGFGPIAAAALSVEHFRARGVRRAALVGSAGSLDPDALPVGTAFRPDEVECDGIGVGESDGFETLGLPQVPEELLSPPVEYRLGLAGCGHPASVLTVTAAAANPRMRERRRTRHPRALAEDMESFGVALAARVAGVELTVIRGVSNLAGERTPGPFDLVSALAACRPLLERWAAEPGP
jgi:futalosine hydrolase